MCACQPGGTPCDFMDCSLPDSVFMKFSRQQYWSGLPFPPSGDLPDPVIETVSPALQAYSYVHAFSAFFLIQIITED